MAKQLGEMLGLSLFNNEQATLGYEAKRKKSNSFPSLMGSYKNG
jgi:hypothetical protein